MHARRSGHFNPKAHARHRYRRWIRWVGLAGFALMLVLGLDALGVVRQPNRIWQDTLVALQGRDVRKSSVIVVAVDERSIAALGSWPWRRSTHAALIERLTKDTPLAIGFDIPISESDPHSVEDSKALAAALEQSGKIVLPIQMYEGSSPLTLQPGCPLVASANRVGLDRLPVDDDGILRKIYLREGLRGFEMDHFSLAVLRVGDPTRFSKDLPGSPEGEDHLHTPPSGKWLDWERSHKLMVPFAGPAGHFRRISYIDVLAGTVPPGTFRGKYVLVGTTAASLGGLYETPATDDAGLMPGVEVNANILESLLNRHEVTNAPLWLNTGVNTSVVLLAFVGMAVLEPVSALLMTGALALALLVVSGIGTVAFRLQFAPAAGILGLGTAYTLWSWGRLNAATRYLIEASAHLRASASIAQVPAMRMHSSGDFLDRRIKGLAVAAQHLRNVHQLVSDSLDNLPDATLVCGKHGDIRLANAAAARYFNADSAEALQNLSIVELMRQVRSVDDNQPVATPASLARHPLAGAVQARDQADRDLLVKHAPSLSIDGQHAGWIFSLVDVSEMRRAQRQHDDAIHFLSHDIRAPQTAIVTLLELNRHDPAAMTAAQFRERIARHAHKALALSEGFIQLARARSQPYRIELRNLPALLNECIDDAWEAHASNQIQVVLDPSSATKAFCRIDRDLVSRAIDNLLDNAIKHSPPGSTIGCAIELHGDCWAVRIQDQGPGIAADRQATVFEPFERGDHGGGRSHGAGLGLAFVKTVAARHGGRVSLYSAEGMGCVFRLFLPRAPGSRE
ncbi:CHASE2 domain-containing protein [Variovorax paradoxus]|uniref:histidine kinase n=1 Tax=Variovorax paradoxus TaxID=34073 RepID=A0A6I6HIG0_VARPD|nr:CHASE2 domain-containing protein [Variovorax paradoxus]